MEKLKKVLGCVLLALLGVACLGIVIPIFGYVTREFEARSFFYMFFGIFGVVTIFVFGVFIIGVSIRKVTKTIS
jgi:hypothetical protein